MKVKLEPNLPDISAGEEFKEPKVVGVNTTDRGLYYTLLCIMPLRSIPTPIQTNVLYTGTKFRRKICWI